MVSHLRKLRAGVLAAALTVGPAAAAVAGASAEPAAAAAPAASTGGAAFAVVELFTSQGCNSCPRAEQSLARLGAQTGGLPVFPVEWHVDYWDYLGWPDPYAIPEAARRQRSYAAALGSRVYTPQLVVNGREVVRPAQDYSLVHAAAIAAVGAGPAPDAAAPTLLLSPPVHDAGGVRVDYEVRAAPPGSVLTVVAVETGLENFVPRGENRGRTLRHHNVARGFATVALGAAAAHSGQVRIDLPEGVARAASAIIGYVQQRSDLQIVAAAQAAPG